MVGSITATTMARHGAHTVRAITATTRARHDAHTAAVETSKIPALERNACYAKRNGTDTSSSRRNNTPATKCNRICFYNSIGGKAIDSGAQRKATVKCPDKMGVSSLTSRSPHSSCTCDGKTPRLTATAKRRSPVVTSFVSNCMRSPAALYTSTTSRQTGAKPWPRRMRGAWGGTGDLFRFDDVGVDSPSASRGACVCGSAFFVSTAGPASSTASMARTSTKIAPAGGGGWHTRLSNTRTRQIISVLETCGAISRMQLQGPRAQQFSRRSTRATEHHSTKASSNNTSNDS
jgi:hypothetical protein